MYIEISIARSGYNIEQGRDKAGTRQELECQMRQGQSKGGTRDKVWDKARDKAGEHTTGVDQTGELD